jgi:CheY-like chemotaxis protein
LSISAGLVDLMNGKIWVESRINKGSVFNFTISLELPDKIAKVLVPADIRQLKDLPVLVVDDNETNCRVLKDILLNWKMKPEVAQSGKQALQILQKAQKLKKQFALILVDVQMPKMDGFQLVEHLKKEPIKYAPTIMMLTSLGIRGDSERCQKLGIAAYLVKPVKQTDLLDAILLLMGKKASQKKATDIVTRHTIREQQKKYSILVAEDNIINQKLIQRLLEKEGHQVTLVDNGKKALTVLGSKKFDLILMDVQMPVMDGLEATSRIRRKKEINDIPIIAMTAHAMKGDKERCLAAGMDDYASKPIDFDKLKNTIKRIMTNRAE